MNDVAMPKTLVVGASGQVGTQMLAGLGDAALPTSRLDRSRQPAPSPRGEWLTLDLADLAELSQAAALLDAHALRAIYCVGGMTYVDGCEADPHAAWQTNARGPGVLAAYARQRAVPYVFFSTDYIFDGTAANPGPYAEEAQPCPLSVYGKTKLEGEQRVLAANAAALVLRTTTVYGADPRHKNFLYSMMRALKAGETMRVPMDQVSTPTCNRDLIAATAALVATGERGIFHVAGPELMDRLEFARRAAAWLGLNVELLQGVTTAELGQPAPRPLAAGLKIEKLARLHPELRMRGLTESLDDCQAQLREFLRVI